MNKLHITLLFSLLLLCGCAEEKDKKNGEKPYTPPTSWGFYYYIEYSELHPPMIHSDNQCPRIEYGTNRIDEIPTNRTFIYCKECVTDELYSKLK
jgi:hypothetical protein